MAKDGADGKDGQDVQDGADGKDGQDGKDGAGGEIGYVYLGEDLETIDGQTYNVQRYADVTTHEGYFYTYYKFYYLNDHLRKIYTFYHSIGVTLDYRYDEFEEHWCGGNSASQLYNYSESGKIEIIDYYRDGGFSSLMYFENGKQKANASYTEGEITYLLAYYPSGNTRYSYINGSLSTYADEKNSSPTIEDRTAEQIAQLWQELILELQGPVETR